MSIYLSAKHLLACMENIHDIFLEEATEALDVIVFNIARKRKIRTAALTAAGAMGIAALVFGIVKSKRVLKSA
jgi:hypothetical protein